MTDLTENLKSGENYNKNTSGIQDSLLKKNIAEQNSIIDECQRILEENEAKINIAHKVRDFCMSQLGVSEPNQTTRIVSKKSPNQRQKHRLLLRNEILKALEEASNTALYKDKGIMAGDIKEIMHGNNKDLRVSPNTIGHVMSDLIEEGVIFCVNPNQLRHRRFLMSKKEVI